MEKMSDRLRRCGVTCLWVWHPRSRKRQEDQGFQENLNYIAKPYLDIHQSINQSTNPWMPACSGLRSFPELMWPQQMTYSLLYSLAYVAMWGRKQCLLLLLSFLCWWGGEPLVCIRMSSPLEPSALSPSFLPYLGCSNFRHHLSLPTRYWENRCCSPIVQAHGVGALPNDPHPPIKVPKALSWGQWGFVQGN